MGRGGDLVSPDVAEGLERTRRHIEAALVYAENDHDFDDVVALVESGKAQAWFGPESVIITQITDAPRKTYLSFFLAGGKLQELEAMVPKVLEWGKQQGCVGAMLIGRRGWERTFLVRTGWTSELVVMKKAI